MITDILLCISVPVFQCVNTALLMLDNFNPDVDRNIFIICGIRKIKMDAHDTGWALIWYYILYNSNATARIHYKIWE